MRRWKILCGLLTVTCIALAAMLYWQHQHVKSELIREYYKHSSFLEQTLAIAVDEYAQSGDEDELAENLLYVYAEARHAYESPPSISELNGNGFTADVDYLFEIRDQFNFYIIPAVQEAFLAAKKGELRERQFQKLTAYHRLVKELNEGTFEGSFYEWSIEDYEENFKGFYLNNEEEISSLIN